MKYCERCKEQGRPFIPANVIFVPPLPPGGYKEGNPVVDDREFLCHDHAEERKVEGMKLRPHT